MPAQQQTWQFPYHYVEQTTLIRVFNLEDDRLNRQGDPHQMQDGFFDFIPYHRC
jgi:hypothetical protein